MKNLLKVPSSHFEPEDSLPWNLNIADRSLRLFSGGMLFTTPLYLQGPVTWQITVLSFTGLYLGMTGFLGWDPFREGVDRRLGRTSRRHRYSSFARQVLALMTGIRTPLTRSVPNAGSKAAQASIENKGYKKAA
jgi:hypothetical protein